ncbi:MAG: DUF4037 domain-containing protein [Kitasatospora sp.]|jgi:hypothetical protein|nr:DUF4037 domain-containing protein [Kitasatospora sp.]
MPFLPGLQLAGEYYAQVVRPLLDETFPGLPHSAARLGEGSEVLGFDTQRSTDHDWGPRLQIFLADGDTARYATGITAMLAGRLPAGFRGYPTAYELTADPGGGARHRVEVTGLGAWLAGWLGFDPRRAVTLLDWLATPTQRLAEMTGGAVFHDGLGELGPARARLAWYPGDVWRYVLACQWQRIAQEEGFPGRCAETGDELGSAVVTARLVRDLMRLALLMHRRDPPYSKWLGTAFARLPDASRLGPALAAAVSATRWPDRERSLVQALEAAAARHNDLGLTAPLDITARGFFDRPYQVLEAGRFVTALREAIRDPRIRRLPATGAVDQFADSTDALRRVESTRAMVATIYGLPAEDSSGS